VCEPDIVIQQHQNYFSHQQIGIVKLWGRFVPQDVINRGSESLTIGNRRMFPRYTTCETMLRRDSPKGNLSMRQRRTWIEITAYIRRVRSFLANTVCSSTSSER